MMAVCANCDHPVQFHGAGLGCAARYAEGDPVCGCTWHEDATRIGPVTLAAVAKPGDTVLIGFAHQLTDEDIEALGESFRHLISQGIKVGFMDQVTSMVVFRPEYDVNGAPLRRTETLEGYEVEGER